MIDVKKAVEEFIKYTENYDLTNEHINRKQSHSIRVMKLCEKIAKSSNLSEEKIQLAELIGLLHDIARFEQYTQYKTFHDLESFDHGDYGAEILKKDIRKYIETKKYDNIIIKAVKNHNKYKIDESLKDEELLYAKIVRDADKIDIIYEWTNLFFKNRKNLVEDNTISDYIIQEFEKEKLIKREESHKYTNAEHIVTTIAFIFDFNFKSDYRIIYENNYINKIIDRFNFKSEDTIQKMEKVRNIANDYIKENLI